jgi:hypothetical protein
VMGDLPPIRALGLPRRRISGDSTGPDAAARAQ